MSKVNTLFVGQVRHHYNECESTNTTALEEVSKRKPVEGTAITAGHQTHGRGRHQRVWQSSANNNLLVSYIFLPTFLAPHQQWLLNVMATVAIADVLARHGIECECRWPNDVLVKGKKISGILFQNGIGQRSLRYAICGIGMNVLQKSWSSNVEAATSLAAEGAQTSIHRAFSDLSSTLEHRYLALKAGRLDALIQSYNAILDKDTRVYISLTDGRILIGKLQYVTTTGILHLLNTDTEHSFSVNLKDVGDVSHRAPQ